MRALIVIDMQNDFMPGGPLGVPGADEIIPTIAALCHRMPLVIATQDWHPPDHGSFAANHAGKAPYDVIDLNGISQVLWPVHCVQGTAGAEFVAGVPSARFSAIVRKGTDPGVDSYSGFADNDHKRRTGLAGLLTEQGVREVLVCGVATDYCVRFTAQDALAAGFSVSLITDAVRAVGLREGDEAAAIAALQAAGVAAVQSHQLGG